MSKTRAELAVDLLKAYRNWIGLAVLVIVATAVAAIAFLGIDLPTIQISRDQKVFAMAAVLLGILGYFPLAKIYGWLYDPPKRYIVSLGLSGEPGIYELTPAAWQDVTVIEDELYQWEGMTWPTYEAEGFDPNSMTAVGTWRASEPDSELLRYEKRLDEVRNDLEEQADTSIDTEIQISSRVLQRRPRRRRARRHPQGRRGGHPRSDAPAQRREADSGPRVRTGGRPRRPESTHQRRRVRQ